MNLHCHRGVTNVTVHFVIFMVSCYEHTLTVHQRRNASEKRSVIFIHDRYIPIAYTEYKYEVEAISK